MSNRAGEDLFGRFVGLVLVVVLVLIAAQLYLTSVLNQPGTMAKDAEIALAAVIPNFIAALVASLLVYLFVKNNDAANYVKAMRSLRSTIHGLMMDKKITSEEVQVLMVRFVPVISQLYFKNAEPTVPRKEIGLNRAKVKCYACERPVDVKNGRCGKCNDIQASWRDEELS